MRNLNVPLEDSEGKRLDRYRDRTVAAAKEQGKDLTNWGDVVLEWAEAAMRELDRLEHPR